jgi:uncharacterized protein (DUF433 family)
MQSRLNRARIQQSNRETRQKREKTAMTRHERIVRDPRIMVGKPVIRGTRITVEHILRKLGAGLTPEQIIAEHTHLTVEDIRAAQAFAADYLGEEELVLG